MFVVLAALPLPLFLGPHREGSSILPDCAAGGGTAHFLFEFFDALLGRFNSARSSCRCSVTMTSIKRSTSIRPSRTSCLSCSMASMPATYQTDLREAAPNHLKNPLGNGRLRWKRLRIMASEDVGPAEPTLAATIEALYHTYSDLKKKKDEAHAPQRLQLVHAVILLAQARKNRIVDHALIHHFTNHARLKRPIPDFALDKHTAAGKRLGRGDEHFFAEGIKLENESGEDPYRELARQTLTAGAATDPAIEAADLFT